MRLTVETGPLAGTVVPLDREHPTLLGSAPECALRVQEPGVAAQQAVVKALKDQGFGVKALAPGLRVNGAAVEATPLADGDVIELGTTRIAFGQVQKRGLPHIAGYRILEELGRGGMGIVYRAEQTSLHREVALKVLSRELTKDPAFVARFVAEARAAAKLQHPNVVQVFDIDHDGETYFITMELMREGSLEDVLKQQGVLPVDRALRVIADAAAGLAYAESLDIVHRDIKPDNLMLDQHGAVKIADLGLATQEEGEEQAIGTPHFLAPEQVLRKPLDHRTDLYALGCTFYRLVTGRTPFRGQSVKDILRAQVKEDAEPAHKANPDVPADVSNIVAKLMAKEPSQRYQTANDLIEDLGVLLQPPAKKGLWIGLAATAALVAGGAIWWAVTKPKDIETVTEYVDNPEAARLAKDNAQLKKELREARASIAVLTARASGIGGRELADALDRVAAEHSDTLAAAEARQLATRLRADAEASSRELELRRGHIADFIAGLRQTSQGHQDVHDYAAALKALDAAPPAELRGDAELERGVQALRDQVLGKAKDRLHALTGNVATATKAKDEAALVAAIDTLATATAAANRWPPAMKEALTEANNELATARSALTALTAERGEAIWQQYAAMFTADAGLRVQLARHDYAAATAAAMQFAGNAGTSQAGPRATGLAAALTHAGTFADALERAAAGGQLQLTNGGNHAVHVVRWDRAAGQLVTSDPAKKPAKEQPVPAATLTLEQWTALAEQVPPPAAGTRECFAGFLALGAHANAANTFLQKLKADDDASGTGDSAYPLSATLFDTLLRRLPDQDEQPWAKAMRAELQAGQHLAAGLRALSERRNVTAASHLEKLLAEHPHS